MPKSSYGSDRYAPARFFTCYFVADSGEVVTIMKRAAYLIAATALGVGALAQTAAAQQPVTQIIGGTIITLGGGAQLLSLPDLDFTFKVNEEGAAVRKQTNSGLDDYGGAFVGLGRDAVWLLGKHSGDWRRLRLLCQCPEFRSQEMRVDRQPWLHGGEHRRQPEPARQFRLRSIQNQYQARRGLLGRRRRGALRQGRRTCSRSGRLSLPLRLYRHRWRRTRH